MLESLKFLDGLAGMSLPIKLVLTAVCLVALFQMWMPVKPKPTDQPGQAAVAGLPPAVSAVPASPGTSASVAHTGDDQYFVSPEAFIKRRQQLEPRFAERDAFLGAAVGRPVKWQGALSDVSLMKYSDGTTTILMHVDSGIYLERVKVRFPEEFRTQAYGMRKGDVVEVGGTIIESDTLGVKLQGDHLRWIADAPGPASSSAPTGQK